MEVIIYHCITPAGYSVIIQDGSVHDRNFSVYIGNIEGYVKELIHDHDENGNPVMTTNYIEGSKVEILENNKSDFTNAGGHYSFSNIVSNWYNLKATKTITLPGGETYKKTYNPSPRFVQLCIADELNQISGMMYLYQKE